MTYVSPWLTHFVGRQQPDDEARCKLLLKILKEKRLGQWDRKGGIRLDPGTMLISSAGSLCKDEFIGFRPVCFCDIPESSLKRHINVYGCFGLAFAKNFLVAKGANPVFYIAKGSLAGYEQSQVALTEEDLKSANAKTALSNLFAALQNTKPVLRCEFFDRLIADLMSLISLPIEGTASSEEEKKMRIIMDLCCHVFAFTKFFDESLREGDAENYYMEREWRVAGFVQFDFGDLQRIYVPPAFCDRIEREFAELKGKVVELD